VDLPDDLGRLLGIALPQPPAPHPPEAVNEDRPDDADLPSERGQDILRALLLLNAVGPRSSVSRRQAALKVDPACNATSYNGPIASLVRDGLAQSRKGPRGGIWLTAKGRSLAERLSSSRRQ
jgi:Mn-dependent DtxR family transcriptional regulator